VNDHASRRPDTSADEIVDSGAFLVLAMSPFAYGHDPVGTAAPGNDWLAGAGLLAADGAAITATKTSAITGVKGLARKHRRHVTFARVRSPPPYEG